MLLTSNEDEKFIQVKTELQKEFEMNDMDEPREFLGITIIRDKKKRHMQLVQEKYIDKLIYYPHVYKYKLANHMIVTLILSSVHSDFDKKKMSVDFTGEQCSQSNLGKREKIKCIDKWLISSNLTECFLK